jgi:outer membrane receptor protein involved in Fe transport
MGLPASSVRRAALLCSSAAALCAAPIAAHAADATAVAQTTAASADEIVVTARKREERLIDVPAPITAISGKTLQENHDVKFSDYLETVPGANFQTGREGATLLILRGIATGAANPTVATYIDDSPFGSSTIFALGASLTPDIDPGNLDHIEILRGPQGTLYGANAIGGIVKFVTIPPNLTTFGGRVEATGVTVDHGGDGWGLRGMVNVPLVDDKLAVQVSGYTRDDPGFIKDVLHGTHDINDTRIWGGRIDVLWQPTDDLKVRLSAMAHHLEGPESNAEDVTLKQTDPNHGVVIGPTEGDLEVQRFVPEPLDINYRLYNGAVTWTPGPVSLISSTSFSTEHVDAVSDLTAQFAPLLHGAVPAIYPANLGVSLLRDIDQSKFTQEVRLSSAGTRKLDWQVGVYFSHEGSTANDPASLFTVPSDQPFTTALPAFQNVFDASLISRYTEEAVFGDVDYHFTPQFDVTGGVRYSHDSQDFTQPASGILFGPAQTSHSTGDESAWTWLVNPRYKLGEDNTLYIRIATGYRPGGPNVVPPKALNFPATFAPDYLTNYEGGWKAELLQHTLSIDSSVYYLAWTHMQLPTVIGGFSAQANGGAAHSEGFESQAIWSPLPGLSLEGDATYADSVMDSNNAFAGAFKGDRLPFVPLWNWGLSAAYTHPIADGWDGSVSAIYRNIGSRPNAFIVNSLTSGFHEDLPGYYTLDLQAAVSRGPIEISLFAKNVTDQRGITTLASSTGSLAPNPPGLNPYEAAVITPRTIGLSVATKF